MTYPQGCGLRHPELTECGLDDVGFDLSKDQYSVFMGCLLNDVGCHSAYERTSAGSQSSYYGGIIAREERCIFH